MFTSSSEKASSNISRFKLLAFVTDAPWLLEALSTATPSPEELASIPRVFKFSSEKASSNVSTFKLHAFVTDAPWLLEAVSTVKPSPEEPTSTPQLFTSSLEKASSTSTAAPAEKPASAPSASIPTPETALKPVNHSQDQTLEDAEIAESDGFPNSDGVHLLTTINNWHKIYKLPLLKRNRQLELNALKTGTDGAGLNQNHELNKGTMAQVISPGMYNVLKDIPVCTMLYRLGNHSVIRIHGKSTS